MAKLEIIRKQVNQRTGTKDSRGVSLTVKDIPIGDIRIKENIRKEYAGIDELASNIRKYELIQPITVYPEGDYYIIKTGHRRFQAYSLLFKQEPERYHSIRCIISDADNIAVIQLVENVQREGLSQLDFSKALNALREQGMTLKQIAEIIGKSEKYAKNLFTAINEINEDEQLQVFLDGPGAGTILDILETKGIKDSNFRRELIQKRAKGEISQKQLRKMVRQSKMPIGSIKQPIDDIKYEAEDFKRDSSYIEQIHAPELCHVFSCSMYTNDEKKEVRFSLRGRDFWKENPILMNRFIEDMKDYFKERGFTAEHEWDYPEKETSLFS
jgi:ParB family chromosome partitioning protein